MRSRRRRILTLMGGSGGGEPPPPSPPANTVAPALSGSQAVGGVLSTTDGTWTGSPTGYTYQWQRNTGGGWGNIASATASSYTLVLADFGALIRCVVTATNADGSTAANSNALVCLPWTDNFNRADGALDGSTGWTRSGGSSGDGVIFSNAVRSGTASTPGTVYGAPDPLSLNHFAEADLNANSFSFVIVRGFDASNYVGMRRSGGNIQAFTSIAGTLTSRYSAGPGTNTRWRLEANGNLFRLLGSSGGGFSELWSATFTDTNLNNSNRTGFCFRAAVDTGTPFDNFATGPL